MASPAIELSGLRFRWPRQAAACLDIPAFAVPAGQRLFLHGPSGSGKSTLLNLLGGVMLPAAGTLRILGEDMGRLGTSARDRLRADRMGFLFQQFNLLPYLPALDNVLLPCAFSPRRRDRAGGDTGMRAEAVRLLERLDLAPECWRRAAADLSVGQQQRVAAARALIGRPEIIVADEPTSALDAERQQAFIDLLLAESAAVGATLLFVSHDRRLAGHFDREVALAEINAARPPVRVAP